MNEKTKEYRQKIADIFIKSLEENQLSWKKEWQGLFRKQENAITGKSYRGINQFYLSMVAQENTYGDYRWATFKQIENAGWHLKKGSKGTQVEYWLPYDKSTKSPISWGEFRAMNNEENIILISKYYTVFNGSCIEGIPQTPIVPLSNISPDEIISTLSQNMNVEIIHEDGDNAFYRPSEDKIHLPRPEFFKNDYAYNSTALHELAHSTGAIHRLNRNIKNMFGQDDYAFEELVAEISSCFMGESLQFEQGIKHIENHKAYVQSWIRNIKEKPDTLIKAIREAERCANYMQHKAGIMSEQEYTATISSTFETSESEVFSISDFKLDKEIFTSNDKDEYKKFKLHCKPINNTSHTVLPTAPAPTVEVKKTISLNKVDGISYD